MWRSVADACRRRCKCSCMQASACRYAVSCRRVSKLRNTRRYVASDGAQGNARPPRCIAIVPRNPCAKRAIPFSCRPSAVHSVASWHPFRWKRPRIPRPPPAAIPERRIHQVRVASQTVFDRNSPRCLTVARTRTSAIRSRLPAFFRHQNHPDVHGKPVACLGPAPDCRSVWCTRRGAADNQSKGDHGASAAPPRNIHAFARIMLRITPTPVISVSITSPSFKNS